MTIELTDKNFFSEIINLNLPVFIDFWANWCPPCRMMDPLIEDLADEYEGRIVIAKLNTDLNRKIPGKLNISGIPTYIIFNKEKEVYRKVGAVSKKELIEAFESLITNGK